MNHYNFLAENVLKTKTHWSKSNQVNAINELVLKYPTAKQFKNAVIRNGDRKSIELIQNLPDNASRSDYVDFLQSAFTKYSTIGKNILSAAAGVGIGAATAYAAGKAVDASTSPRTNSTQEAPTTTQPPTTPPATPPAPNNQALIDPTSYTGRALRAMGAKTNSLGGIVGNRMNAIGLNGQRLSSMASRAAADTRGEIFSQQRRGIQALGGAAGFGLGTAGAHGIQSWRQKKLQDRIEALKNGY